jgi:hypothetical protein
MSIRFTMMCAFAVAGALFTAGAAATEPIRVEYLLDQKAFKAGAIVGNPLNFELFSDDQCTTLVGSAPLFVGDAPIQYFVDKRQRIKDAPKLPKAVRLVAVIDGPVLASAPYLKVSGTGVVGVGGACQLQPGTAVSGSGPSGPAGPAGADGADGAAGSVGPQGDPGLPGTDGVDGAAGAVGPQGDPGLPGTDGVDGAAGAVGPQGDPGLPGTDGVDGAAGAVGPQGDPGLPGTDGVDGAAGAVGPQGDPGLPGTDGVDGADGAPGGVSGYLRVSGTVSATDSTSPKTATADCTGGQKVLGGGYTYTAGTGSVVTTQNMATDDDTWTVIAEEIDPDNDSWSVQAFAICADAN